MAWKCAGPFTDVDLHRTAISEYVNSTGGMFHCFWTIKSCQFAHGWRTLKVVIQTVHDKLMVIMVTTSRFYRGLTLHILQYKQVDKRAVNTSVSKINRTICTKFHRSRMKYKRIRHCSQHASKRTCSRLSSNSTRCRSDCSRRFIRANWSKTSAPQQQRLTLMHTWRYMISVKYSYKRLVLARPQIPTVLDTDISCISNSLLNVLQNLPTYTWLVTQMAEFFYFLPV